jgi:hypothetical protein
MNFTWVFLRQPEFISPILSLWMNTMNRCLPLPHVRLLTLLVMSGALVGSSVLVNYVRDRQGLISEAWILSPEGARAERSGLEVATNFIFGSDADKPKPDDGKTRLTSCPSTPSSSVDITLPDLCLIRL